MQTRRSLAVAISALGLLASMQGADAQSGKVTVVTSFAKDVTDPVKRAFEKAVPGAVLEVVNGGGLFTTVTKD